jgi:glycosyltransferase involved in cell wall biosynthesis
MRIGFWLPAVGFQGGVERHSFDFANALRKRGHRVALLHEGERGANPDAFAHAFDDVRSVFDPRPARGLEVVYVQKATLTAPWTKLDGVPPVFASHDHDFTCVRSHRYTPIGNTPCHRAPGAGCALRGCVVRRSRGGSLPIALGNPWSLARSLKERAARGPLVACSRYIAARLVDAGVPQERVSVVHPIAPATPGTMTAPPRQRRLLVVGQLIRGKGVDLAIEAVAALPKDVTLEVLGDGNARAELERLAQERAPGRVRFIGYVSPDRVDHHYRTSRLVLVPSRWPEPFGMVGIEAMRHGRAVVGAAHGGIPEWLKPPDAGRLFEPGNSASLARAISSLIDDTQAGARAEAYARKSFCHDRAATALERVLLSTVRAEAA